LLKSYEFLYDPEDAVEIMEGTNEGKFAWITVNYLLGSVHKPAEKTLVVLDLGGGSTQVDHDGWHPQPCAIRP
jgi:Golgi nucleoside diphosphatase